MLARARSFIRTHRRSFPLKAAATISEKYLRAFYNEDFYQFDKNGEAFLLNKVNQWARGRSIHVWDIGAHEGEWAMQACLILPEALVTSFEIIPSLASKLIDNVPKSSRFLAHCFGLSDTDGTVQVTWNETSDTCNSINPRLSDIHFHNANLNVLSCPVRSIDSLIEEGYSSPHVLKIDTEGHEMAVLLGSKSILDSDSAPQLIQFEYGDTWIPSRYMLSDVYELLGARYSIGRLFPNHVDFKKYSYRDETFRMGNMIAVRDKDLIDLLR